MQASSGKQVTRLTRRCVRCEDLEWLYKEVEHLQKVSEITSSRMIERDSILLKEIAIEMINKFENSDCACSHQLIVDYPV